MSLKSNAPATSWVVPGSRSNRYTATARETVAAGVTSHNEGVP